MARNLEGWHPRPRIELDARQVGITLKASEDDQREIEEIQAEAARARAFPPKLLFD